MTANSSAAPPWAMKAAEDVLWNKRRMFGSLEQARDEAARIIYASVEGPIREAVEALEKRLASLVGMQTQWLDEFESARKRKNQSKMYHLRPNLTEARGRIEEVKAALANLRGLSDAQKEKPE